MEREETGDYHQSKGRQKKADSIDWWMERDEFSEQVDDHERSHPVCTIIRKYKMGMYNQDESRQSYALFL